MSAKPWPALPDLAACAYWPARSTFPGFAVKQYWHTRYQHDADSRWLSGICAALFMKSGSGAGAMVASSYLFNSTLLSCQWRYPATFVGSLALGTKQWFGKKRICFVLNSCLWPTCLDQRPIHE